MISKVFVTSKSMLYSIKVEKLVTNYKRYHSLYIFINIRLPLMDNSFVQRL